MVKKLEYIHKGTIPMKAKKALNRLRKNNTKVYNTLIWVVDNHEPEFYYTFGYKDKFYAITFNSLESDCSLYLLEPTIVPTSNNITDTYMIKYKYSKVLDVKSFPLLKKG